MKLPEMTRTRVVTLVAGLVVLVIAIGVTVATLSGSHNSTASRTASSDHAAREQITAVIQESIRAMQNKDAAAFNRTQCTAKRPSDTEPSDVDDLLSKIRLNKIDPITIKSESTAQAVIHFDYPTQPGQSGKDNLDLVKENGAWLIC